MFSPAIDSSSLATLDLRDELTRLEGERARALSAAPADVDLHITKLEGGLDHRRRLYVAAAVTQTLRVEPFGPVALGC